MPPDLWSHILLLAASVYSGSYFSKIAFRDRHIVPFFLFLTVLLIAVYHGILLADNERTLRNELITGWLEIGSVGLVLTALFFIIRNSKPVFARFPKLFAYMPLAVLPFFVLIQDVETLKRLVNLLFQGGAVLVTILLMIRELFKNRSCVVLLVGVMFMTFAWVWNWFGYIFMDANWLTSIFFSIGMIISTFGFDTFHQTKLNT